MVKRLYLNQPGRAALCYPLRAHSFIRKPFDAGILLGTIHEALDAPPPLTSERGSSMSGETRRSPRSLRRVDQLDEANRQPVDAAVRASDGPGGRGCDARLAGSRRGRLIELNTRERSTQFNVDGAKSAAVRRIHQEATCSCSFRCCIWSPRSSSS